MPNLSISRSGEDFRLQCDTQSGQHQEIVLTKDDLIAFADNALPLRDQALRDLQASSGRAAPLVAHPVSLSQASPSLLAPSVVATLQWEGTWHASFTFTVEEARDFAQRLANCADHVASRKDNTSQH